MPAANAIILEQPERLSLAAVTLAEPGPGDVVVEVDWTGISTGTEKLLYSGRMPAFPGMGYPLVPGYEAVGRVADGERAGQTVFVPGATCFGEIRSLFGGAASRLVVPSARAVSIEPALQERGVLFALAATAHHALAAPGARLPDLIVGHGVLGRLMARLTTALGGPAPTVWDSDPGRRDSAAGYPVLDPDADPRSDYSSIYDVSGDSGLLDRLIARLAPGGEVVLAGFYADPLRFAFPPAFMRESRIRVAAEWRRPDLAAVVELVSDGRLSLDGLITHRATPDLAEQAYRTAFGGGECLKMILDWRTCS